MFYLGVYIGEEKARVVVVEKEYFSGKRRYHVAHVDCLDGSEDEVTSQLLRMRLDERWTAVKKVFSQSGRPPRKKAEPPLILLSSFDDGLHMAQALRRRCASVEVMVRQEPGDAFREKLKAKSFHNCHVVEAADLFRSMGRAVSKGRLDQAEMALDTWAELSPIGDALRLSPHDLPSFNGTTPWFYALGNCIWHGETVRRVKRY